MPVKKYAHFLFLCRSEGLPMPSQEYKFHPTRKWRFDFAWPDWKIALEVEGGVWQQGRHTRGSGFVKDMEKYNAAAVLGWRLYRVQPSQLMKMKTVRDIKAMLDYLPE